MTISAPHGLSTEPLSEGKPCEMQETMEEVRDLATGAAPSEAPRQDATRLHPRARVPAPLSAPYVVLVRGGEELRTRLIYGLVDPRKPGRVRYVGQTTAHYAVRYLSHISQAWKNTRPTVPDLTRRAGWIKALRREDVAPDMVLLEMVAPDADLTEREHWWIATLRDRGQADLNRPLPRHFVERFRSGGAR
jgi:hypothetical protein